jgi:hypothetical protein
MDQVQLPAKFLEQWNANASASLEAGEKPIGTSTRHPAKAEPGRTFAPRASAGGTSFRCFHAS